MTNGLILRKQLRMNMHENLLKTIFVNTKKHGPIRKRLQHYCNLSINVTIFRIPLKPEGALAEKSRTLDTAAENVIQTERVCVGDIKDLH
jgi:hypothetical protein